MPHEAPPPPYSQVVPGYYQPPPQNVHVQGAPAAASGPTVIIHTTAPTFNVISNEPATITCPSCHAVVRTTVIYQPSLSTHLWALILCLFICWPCVCVPYCMNSCQNANHYCPNCNAFIGSYRN
ncbi:lipopolysaccharide-induced tumor necrosis factor-alpha factor homolog isoform X2 [Anastrepha ludens]|uniref:lipopolysaccharide-induced tumor necrosis factor-alpha factor homolog isoform X2 n=1 Tax=Anastrepha ludens TaxID=28586 RepID=UPI0023AFCD67|nr:lipopolysaccharide-induced tumor necrosis factor-alpha factor homolog isoform X2 [Anastrepha ludens]